MMHLDDELTLRLLHGELTPPAERSARGHLAECAECRGRLAEASLDDAELRTQLRVLDHPVPKIEVEMIVARAGGSRLRWGRWAAGALLTLGMAGAAYAVPGSPLPGWITSLTGSTTNIERPIVQERVAAAPSASQTNAAGIAVAPGRSLVIEFSSHQATGVARVTMTDEADVVLRAPGGSASFTSNPEAILVENRGSAASYEIAIPRTAPRVEIRVAQDRLFLKQGSQMSGAAPASNGTSFVLSLSARAP